MIPRLRIRYLALVLFFTFCQVIGIMCALPNLSVAKETAMLSEEHMVCPMDGTIMCPPLISSSPERQLKPTLVADVDHTPVLLSSVAMFPVSSNPTLWSWSSASSIVPISISSSSVLRI